MTTLEYNISGWKAWTAVGAEPQPDVSVIPAMLRRRLSLLGRAALSVVIPLIETHGAMPLVFVSRHGDAERTLGLLEQLASAEPLSPTAFSLSVHNAIAGLFSIHQGLTTNITAISAGAEELIPALIETLGQCQATDGPVLCVFCDTALPEIYQGQCDQPGYAYALALVIAPGSDWQLTLTEQGDDSGQHQVLSLLELLENPQHQARTFASNGTQWSLQRRAS